MIISKSMSRKGYCLENSPLENFFCMLKQAVYYSKKIKDYDELKIPIEEYIRYNNE